MRRSDAVASLLASARLQYGLVRDGGVAGAWRLNAEMHRARARCAHALEQRYYERLSEADVLSARRSATAFVFGSGYSLNAITSDEWRRIAGATTIGFNTFVRERWIDVDFHVVRGWAVGAHPDQLPAAVADLSSLVTANPRYARTVYVYQDDYLALFAHRFLADHGLPRGAKVFPYHTNRTSPVPTMAFADGLVHAMSTLCDAVNLAVCLQCEDVVLAGVDLYDSRYFWVEPDRTVATDFASGRIAVSDTSYRGQDPGGLHSTVANGMVALMARWHDFLNDRGIRLSVYNPKSLLADVMPVYEHTCASS